jgi:virulence factor Mce-like protein
MSRNRSAGVLVNSPVLVGTVTVLVAFVAVFLAYNANAGLPFVPTYDLRAELPSGAKLVKGNEVRIGGFRAGVVTAVEPGVKDVGGRRRAIALVDLELERRIEPLAADSSARIRPRSPLGIKYVELTPGRSRRELAAGDVLPLAQTSESLEFEDVYDTFQPRTREDLRRAAEGLGDAFAARGPDVNEALRRSAPFLARLTPVMRTLAAPRTRLGELVRQLGATAAQLAPVAETPGRLARHTADTVAALNRDPQALRGTLERTPPTLDVATRSLRRTRPLLVETSDLVRRLRPAAAGLPRTLPPIDSALRAGTPVLARSVDLSRRLGAATRALRDLVRDPRTLMSLRDLRTSLRVLRPAIELVAPYQTVCNYTVYFFVPLGEHLSEPSPGGTQQPQLAKMVNQTQPNSVAFTLNSRPWDLPPGQPAQGATFDGQPAGRAMGSPYQPAVDSRGRADCQNGQNGYPNGRLVEPFVRSDGTGLLPDGVPRGTNAAVAVNDYPGRSGGTFKSRELGIDGLEDVP